MNKKIVFAGIIALAAAVYAPAVERAVEMDFAIAPEKINVKRTVTNAKRKNERVEYSLNIPETAGKDFTFQCKLIPLRFKAYAGVAVGIGNDKIAARQLKVQLRLGDKNRSRLSFGSGALHAALMKPIAGIKLETLNITIKYHADSNSTSVAVANSKGKTIMAKENIPLKSNGFSANNIIVSVTDQVGAGESYLSYDAAKQYLSGKSYTNAKFFSTFAVDDVKIVYAE